MPWKHVHRAALGAVLLFLAAVRIPALTGQPNLSQDATEYIDIARNVAAGEGLTLKIRGYFFGDGYGIPYPAETLRRPLFPVLMGAVYRATHSLAAFQWFNLALFLLNSLLLAALLRRAFSPWIAIYSLLLVGLTEPMFLTSIFPWAEQTAFSGLLAALLLVGDAEDRPPSGAGAFACGLACAVAALSRPEYVLCGVLGALWLSARRPGRFTMLLFAAGFLLPLAALSAGNYSVYGRTFLPGDYLFHSRVYASYFSWGAPAREGALSFLAGNWLWIAGRIGLNFSNYAVKLVGWKNLFVLAAVLPLVLRSAWRGEYDGPKRRLAVTGAAFFCAYCLIWAGIDRERYPLAVTTFWLPLCVHEAARLRLAARGAWSSQVWTVVLAALLPLLAANVIRGEIVIQGRERPAERYYARSNAAWDNGSIAALAAWIRSSTAEDEVLCLENPFLVNYMTGRPGVVIPEQIRAEDFLRFLSEYNVHYWINNTVDTRRSAAGLDPLRKAVSEGGGIEVARVGTYQVWRIPRTVIKQRSIQEAQ